MIQRSLLRASRQVAPRIPRTATSPLLSFSAPPRPSSILSRLPALQPSSTRLSSRWYSDTAQARTEPKGASKADDAQKSSESSKKSESSEQSSDVQALKTDLEAKNKEIADLKVLSPTLVCLCLIANFNDSIQDKYLRAVADYRNLSDRTKRDIQTARDFALQKFATDLISSLDTFEHALSSVPAERLAAASSAAAASAETAQADLQSLHKGLQLTEAALLDTLKRHGLVRFDPAAAGDKFDPNLHEAVFQAPMAGKEDGTVFITQQKGFMLNGRVIRAPKVGVVKNS